jgi:hypothetical protein
MKIRWTIFLKINNHFHLVFEVTDIHLEEKDPLIFYSGKYRSLEEEKSLTL